MNQILIYQSEDGRTKLEDRNAWLNQTQLTELFVKAKGTISEHIKHIFEDKELEEDSVVRLFRTTAADGKQYKGRITTLIWFWRSASECAAPGNALLACC